MFYRRKILLAFIEAFGGSLNKADCQKLLFLFCLRTGNNYYDFFPFRYGVFSVILVQDKKRLTDLGYLTAKAGFHLVNKTTYISELRLSDRADLLAFVEEIRKLRGKALTHKIHLEVPDYACRSQIANRVLSPDEYQVVSSIWNTSKAACLFTIGYEGLSIDAYLDLLVKNNVSVLVDVRKNPISMKYGFSKAQLVEYSRIAGITYIHISDLGIPSDLRKHLNDPRDYEQLFDFYAAHILPEHLDALKTLKRIVSKYGRVAITCFEADYHFCHRHKVTEYLEHDPDFNTEIAHICKDKLVVVDNKKKKIPLGLLNVDAVYSCI